MKSILITGAAGEVGLLLTKTFMDEGMDVIGIDHVDRDQCEELAFIGRNALFHFDNQSLDQVDWNKFDRVDVIFHLAHNLPSKQGLSHLRNILRANKSNIRKVVGFAAEKDAKVVLISTIDVYGNHDAKADPNNYSPSPQSLYGSLMLSEESFLRDEAEKLDVHYQIVRIPKLSGFSHPMEKRCRSIDESEKAGISSQRIEMNNGQTLPQETFIDLCKKILNGEREEQIIPLFNK